MIDETYTKQDIAYKLSCSVRTIEEDADYLNLKPQTSPGKPNLYSKSDYKIIQEMRSHCQEGKDRDSFVPGAIAEVVESQPEIVNWNNTPAIATYDSTPAIASETSSCALRRRELLALGKHYLRNDFFTQSYINQAQSDPFYNLELLERCVERGWTLSTYQLALIINKSPRTFTGMSNFNYSGFSVNKIQSDRHLGQEYYWSIEKKS